jgi:competence protein ComEC
VAATSLVVGIALGAWSVGGEVKAGVLLMLAALLGLVRVARGALGTATALAGILFCAAAGFVEGRVAVARREEVSRAAFLKLGAPSGERADRIEGILTDFWSDDPPRARGKLTAERLMVDGRWNAFPAEVFLFVSGSGSPGTAADRGDRVQIAGRLRREEVPASERDVTLPWTRYRLSVKSSLQIRRLGATPLSRLSAPNRWLYGRLPASGSRGSGYERNVRGPLAALLLGRTSQLDRGMVARYRRGGLYHLLVVSGLHVGLAAGIVLGALSVARVGGKRRDAILLAAVFVFVLIGGANAPAVRAGIVVAVFLAARLFERPIGTGQAAGLSALALFATDPKQIYSLGTVLTFAAVAGIALLTDPIRRRLPARPDPVFSALATTLAAECATAPVILWRFNLVSAGAWLTSPLAIPLSAALIALGGTVILLFALGLPAGYLASLFGLGSRSLEMLADRASGMAHLRPTPPLAGVLAVGAATLLAAAGPRRLRRPAAALAAAGFLALAIRPGTAGPKRGFSVEALDVGQGDAILLRWERHAILVDGGGPFDIEAADFGRTRLLPKLLDRGVARLDGVLATHPHPDHALGLIAILEELPVDALWLSAGKDENGLFARLRNAASAAGVPVSVLRPGVMIAWRDARLRVIHSGGRARKTDTINNQSVVAVFDRDGRRALLTGDAGAPTERDLADGGRLRRADLLKVGHHGSRTSTTPQLLAAVRPRLALLSCGRENRFGHPALMTLETLAAFRVPTFRTDRLGDVRAELLPEATRLSWRGLE